MQAATIVPQPYLDLVKDQPYHLALAHLIGAPGFEQYTEFYTAVGSRPDKYLILDNGLIEGDPRPMDELLDKAYRIGADELVLPDVFQDRSATMQAIHTALDIAAMQNITGGDISFMGVPQGSTYEEWLACASQLVQGFGLESIGIPKVLSSMYGPHARLHALKDLKEALDRYGTKVHLLGCMDSPLEIKAIEAAVRIGEILPVRGVDSAIAYVYARSNMRMSEGPRPEGKIDFNTADANYAALVYNIEMWQSECATLPKDRADKIQRIW